MEPRAKPFRWPRFAGVYKWVARSLAALALFVGLNDFFPVEKHAWVFTGPSWQEQVRNWRQSDSDTLYIWPGEWPMELPKEKPGEPGGAGRD